MISGTVAYRTPDSSDYTRITGTVTLPLGVVLDTEKGKVALAAEVDGKTQTGTFNDGKFAVTQTRSGLTELALAGPLACSPQAKGQRVRREEEEEALAVGQGQRRELPHARDVERRDGPRDRVADRGHVRGHDDLCAQGLGLGVAAQAAANRSS